MRATNVPDEVNHALQALKAARGVVFDAANVEKIKGGQHNNLYRLRTQTTDLTLRISKDPDKRKGYFAEELHNHRVAAKQGLAEPIVHFNLNNGLLVYNHIDGEKINYKDMRKPPMMSAVINVLKKLHKAPIKFKHTHNPINSLRRRIKKTIKHMPHEERAERINALVEKADETMDLLQGHHVDLCPVHGDMILDNILETQDSFIFIDWQLSGMGDPHEEVANLLDGCNATMQQGNKAIETYLGGEDGSGKSRIILHWFLISIYWVMRHEQSLQKGEDAVKYKKKQLIRMNEADVIFTSDEYSNAFASLQSTIDL